MQLLHAIDPSVGFAAGLAVALVVLLALEIYNSRRVEKLTAPIYEYALKRAEEEAARMVEDARKEARRLVTEAESAGIALTGTRKKEEEDAERTYEAALASMLERLEKRITDAARAAEEARQKADAMLTAQLEREAADARGAIEASIAALENDARKRLEGEASRLYEEIRTETASYERARKETVDRRILALVGETMRIALQKKLPADIHAELLREALEEAKGSGIF